MPVSIIYHPECDQNFRRDYHQAFQQWMNNNPVHTNQDIRFDQALVLSVIESLTKAAFISDSCQTATVYTPLRAPMIQTWIRTLQFNYRLPR